MSEVPDFLRSIVWSWTAGPCRFLHLERRNQTIELTLTKHTDLHTARKRIADVVVEPTILPSSVWTRTVVSRLDADAQGFLGGTRWLEAISRGPGR